MSNYSQITAFTPKDSLLTGNPAKLVKGSEIDAELAAIATAIATKYQTGDTLNVLGVVVTGAAVPANGIYLPSANTLGFATNTTARGTINSTGNWVINAPSSGVALTISGAGTSAPLTLSAPSTYNAFNATDGTVTSIFGFGGGRNNLYVTSAHALALGTNNTERVVVSSAGNVTINAPSSGSPLTLNGSNLMVLNATGAGSLHTTWQTAGVNKGFIGTDGGGIISGGAGNIFGLRSEGGLVFLSGSTSYRTDISSTGNWTIGAPSSGTTLLVNHGAVAVGISLSNGSGSLDLQASGGSASINTPGAWGLLLRTNSTDAIAIDTSQNIIARGVAQCRYKAADESRTSTTTQTDDADLKITGLAAGTYAVEVYCFLSSASATPGARVGLNWTGTYNAGTTNANGQYNDGYDSSTSSNIYGQATIGSPQIFGIGASGLSHFIMRAILGAASSGTLSVQWAQGTSSASASKMLIGSWMKVTKLS